MKKFSITLAALALFAAAGFFAAYYLTPPPSSSAAAPAQRGASAQEEAALASSVSAPRAKSPRSPSSVSRSPLPVRRSPLPIAADGLSDGEREAMDHLDDLVAEENYPEVQSMLRAYGPSRNPAVRERVVDALGWFGEKAIVDLTPFLGDENEDVRNAAAAQWNAAVAEVEDDREKAALVAQTMLVITDPEMLEEVAFHLFEIEDEAEAVRVVKSVVAAAGDSNPAAVAAAKEAYEFITGDDWTDQPDSNPGL